MEIRLIINNLGSLDEETQQEIQDFISGLTTDWEIEFFSHCDACSVESSLIKVETDDGLIRVCPDCYKKNGK